MSLLLSNIIFCIVYFLLDIMVHCEIVMCRHVLNTWDSWYPGDQTLRTSKNCELFAFMFRNLFWFRLVFHENHILVLVLKRGTKTVVFERF